MVNCPNCGAETKCYHEAYKDGGRSRRVCKDKCQGWKVLAIRERFGKWEEVIEKGGFGMSRENVCKKYRKKPVEIEAVQLNWRNLEFITKWLDSYKVIWVGRITPVSLRVCDSTTTIPVQANVTLELHTLEGRVTACEGDFIIKGIEDEFYPCKEQIFIKSYMKAFLEEGLG